MNDSSDFLVLEGGHKHLPATQLTLDLPEILAAASETPKQRLVILVLKLGLGLLRDAPLPWLVLLNL